MMTQEVIIDPYLLCLPNPCNSINQLEVFISALLGWRGFLDRPDTCVLLSDSARLALHDDGEFPHRHTMAELIDKFECEFADANTVSKIANSILEKTPTLESYYGIESILFDEESFKVDPCHILDRLKKNCRSALIDDLIITSIKTTELSASKTTATAIIASSMREKDPALSEIYVKAEIHDIDPALGAASQHPVPPFSLSQHIPIAFNCEQLIRSIDIKKIWDEASSDHAVRMSIESRITSLISQGADAAQKSNFLIGSNFRKSLHDWNANSRHDYAMITIESCARIVLGIPKETPNEFRESAEKTAKQRTREDRALAFRTHLTKKGVGLRLMFWRHADGTIEFANIGGKGELKIS